MLAVEEMKPVVLASKEEVLVYSVVAVMVLVAAAGEVPAPDCLCRGHDCAQHCDHYFVVGSNNYYS
jgi:hypothetical protein